MTQERKRYPAEFRRRMVESYLARWRVEETIHFIKQSYRLEDIRLLTYERLRSMAALVMAAAYFACVYLGRTAKLRTLVEHMYHAARRIYGIPEFRFYAIADGIKQTLFGRPGLRSAPILAKQDSQLALLAQEPREMGKVLSGGKPTATSRTCVRSWRD